MLFVWARVSLSPPPRGSAWPSSYSGRSCTAPNATPTIPITARIVPARQQAQYQASPTADKTTQPTKLGRDAPRPGNRPTLAPDVGEGEDQVVRPCRRSWESNPPPPLCLRVGEEGTPRFRFESNRQPAIAQEDGQGHGAHQRHMDMEGKGLDSHHGAGERSVPVAAQPRRMHARSASASSSGSQAIP